MPYKNVDLIFNMTSTAKFIEAFKPDQKEHVEWFKDLVHMAENMGDIETHMSMMDVINKNPLGVELEKEKALEWCQIHFCLGMKYAKAVINNKAYIPWLACTLQNNKSQ
jgi:hypothetical protein